MERQNCYLTSNKHLDIGDVPYKVINDFKLIKPEIERILIDTNIGTGLVDNDEIHDPGFGEETKANGVDFDHYTFKLLPIKSVSKKIPTFCTKFNMNNK